MPSRLLRRAASGLRRLESEHALPRIEEAKDSKALRLGAGYVMDSQLVRPLAVGRSVSELRNIAFFIMQSPRLASANGTHSYLLHGGAVPSAVPGRARVRARNRAGRGRAIGSHERRCGDSTR